MMNSVTDTFDLDYLFSLICVKFYSFCNVQRVIEKQNKVVITDRMWARLLSSTNQPSFLGPKDIEVDKKEEVQQTQLLDEGSCLGDKPSAEESDSRDQLDMLHL